MRKYTYALNYRKNCQRTLLVIVLSTASATPTTIKNAIITFCIFISQFMNTEFQTIQLKIQTKLIDKLTREVCRRLRDH